VVENLLLHPKVKGSSEAATCDERKENGGKIKIQTFSLFTDNGE
jgi:hypothetical protein